MARGSSSGDRGRGGLRGRGFKKTSERDANTESGYHSTPKPKFQESLKNQENSQNKYYDDKRINGLNILFSIAIYIYLSFVFMLITILLYYRGLPNFQASEAVMP